MKSETETVAELTKPLFIDWRSPAVACAVCHGPVSTIADMVRHASCAQPTTIMTEPIASELEMVYRVNMSVVRVWFFGVVGRCADVRDWVGL